MKFLTFIALVALPASSLTTNQNYWPLFYGTYKISGWTCEANRKDPGCRDSAAVHVYELNGLTQIDVYDNQGHVIRSNELKEKGDAKNSYRFGGTADAPTFTVEIKDSRGKTNFLNIFAITRTGFVHEQHTNLLGQDSYFRRSFNF